MTTRTQATPGEIRAEVADIDARLEELKERRGVLIAQLATLPLGSYETPAGSFTVRPPSRRFDADRAYTSLPKAAQALCVGPIPALVKAQIPPAALDAFMIDGTGPNTVTLR